MFTALLVTAALAASDPSVRSQSLEVRFTLPEHHASVTARHEVAGKGRLRFRLNPHATVASVVAGGEERSFDREGDDLVVRLKGDEGTLVVQYEAVYAADLERGEVSGQVHNFSVDAHVGLEGVFLGEGSAWHPQWIDEDGTVQLVQSAVTVEPIEGWAFAASGNPIRPVGESDAFGPVWQWETPRPVAGVAVAGNQHEVVGRVHDTVEGPVEVVMHVSAEHREFAPMFLDAACAYLDLYVPLLGAFPFERFTIVENFFSSGFAFPGFTLLGPRVVAMAPRSLSPGYLDHELVHSWWGNGVYVDPGDGDWCEALATYSANYYRQVAEDGEEAGRVYRRNLLMTLSTDPENLDNGILGRWGGPEGAGINRFVGYEKGSFVFMMLERALGEPGAGPDRARLWGALRRFAEEFMGRRARWDDLVGAIERETGEPREAFFEKWIREHTVPITPTDVRESTLRAFRKGVAIGEIVEVVRGEDEEGPWAEIDPDFRVYRVLPPEWIIPTVTGTFGSGGMTVDVGSDHDGVSDFVSALPGGWTREGENLLVIGQAAIRKRMHLISRTPDPIVVDADSFEQGGTRYGDSDQAVLHSMPHPDRPGRFITIFHANGESGWSHLRLIRFYSRDSTVVWDEDGVISRAVYEPSRKIREEASGGR